MASPSQAVETRSPDAGNETKEAPPLLRIAVMISTRNRRSDLARTCAALEKLVPPPDDVIICADGCTDDTETYLKQHHPSFRVLSHRPARGSIASRDLLLRSTSADLVLSLDDDSYPVELDFLLRVRALFEGNPRLAVVDFPQRSDENPASLTATDFGPAKPRGSYSSAGAAIRRSVYLELGGYPAFFFHAYEEPDFALRCHGAGYEVRAEPVGTIRHHYTGVQRNELRTHHFHARNELWSVLLRCPFPQLLAVATFRVARQFSYALGRGFSWALREPLWWWKAILGIPHCLAHRAPLRWSSYLAWMRIQRDPK